MSLWLYFHRSRDVCRPLRVPPPTCVDLAGRARGVLCGPSASLTLTCLSSPLSSSHSPPASCTLLLPTLRRLRPTILTDLEPHLSLSPITPHFTSITRHLSSVSCSVWPVFLASSLLIQRITLDYSFLHFSLSLFPSPSSLSLSFSLLSFPCRLSGDLRSPRSRDHQPYRFPATPDVLIPSRSISSEV